MQTNTHNYKYEQIQRQVDAFLIETLELEGTDIKPDAELKMDFGLTSIDVVSIALFIKKTYGFQPEMTDIKGIITLKDLYDYIEQNMTHDA